MSDGTFSVRRDQGESRERSQNGEPGASSAQADGVGATGWWVVCASCRRIIKAEHARPIMVQGAGRRGAVSLFGCPLCHQREHGAARPVNSDHSIPRSKKSSGEL